MDATLPTTDELLAKVDAAILIDRIDKQAGRHWNGGLVFDDVKRIVEDYFKTARP